MKPAGILRGGIAVSALSFLVLAPSQAQGQKIGLYADASCASCSLEIPLGDTRTIFVSGPSSNIPDPRDFAGGEFRIVGVPDGWTYQIIASPGVLLVGDPLGASGAAFAILDPPTDFCFLIFTLSLTAATPTQNVILSFDTRVPPSDPEHYPCPTIILSDPPGSSTTCFDGQPMFINSDIPCVVSVQSESWTGMKMLYR